MADFASSLPVRTETNGDVVTKLVDGSVNTQYLGIDASGKITIKLDDSSGNGITSQTNGSQRALDVGINVAGVQIDPRAIRALTSSDVVTANQGSANTIGNAWPTKLTDGTNTLSITAAGEAKVDITQPLPAGSNTIGSVGVTNLPTTVDTNFGTVGSSTLRSAAQIGNATGAADFGNGVTSAQTLRTAANLAIGGANVSASNPIPVTMSDASPGTPIQDYLDNSAIAAGASANHDYTVTALKTLSLDRIFASASGKMKLDVKIETGVGTGTFNTIFTGFNSTANPNIDITVRTATQVAAGVRVRLTLTNKDNQAQDLYSTIEGSEV